MGDPVPHGLEVRVSGADAARGYQAARALADTGVEALLSFGLAGGLDPRLGPGAIVIATEVLEVRGAGLDPGEGGLREKLGTLFSVRGHAARAGEMPPPVTADARFVADRHLVKRLVEAGGRHAAAGTLVGVERIARTRGEKAALFVKTRGLAVDMESQGVARAAAERGLPFGVVRVVFDPSNREMPEALARAVRPDGSTTLAPILSSLLLRPFDLGAYLSMALDSAVALRALRRVGRRLGPALLGGL